MEFKKFKQVFQNNLSNLCASADRLFEVEADKDVMWNLYLDSFPEGTNPIYRERREYDCSCCRHFIKTLSAMVVIKDNQVHTIWGFDTGSTTFQPVVDALDAYIKDRAVSGVYIVTAQLEEAEAQRIKAENKEKKRRIAEILADKQDEELRGKSAAELTAMLNAMEE